MIETINTDLRNYLLSLGEIDEMLPDCPDVEEKWKQIAEVYLPDGLREFNAYPTVSLGWMMFMGMAMAQFWDKDWELYSIVDNLYTKLRDERGFDAMDDYVLEDVLELDAQQAEKTSALVGECASRTLSHLLHKVKNDNIEPNTEEAFRAYVDCLHQLYTFGVAVQLKRLGYRMVPLN